VSTRRSPAAGATDEAARFLAFAVPGLAPLLAGELAAIPGVLVQGQGFDGRSDVVLVTAEPSASSA
jgi:hypothetical protein